MTPRDELTLADFLPTVGDGWVIPRSDGPAIDLLLEEAVPLDEPGAGASGSDVGAPAARRPFSLVFRGPLEPEFPQQTLPLRHARLGELAIFLVPIARRHDGMRYQAIFA